MKLDTMNKVSIVNRIVLHTLHQNSTRLPIFIFQTTIEIKILIGIQKYILNVLEISFFLIEIKKKFGKTSHLFL